MAVQNPESRVYNLIVNTIGTFDLTKNKNITPFIIPLFTNTSVTVNIALDGQTNKLIKKANDAGTLVALEVGDIKKNVPIQLVWDSVNNFFIFAPKGGSNIKSIQRGTSSVNSTAINVALTSIDTTKSIVMIQINSNGENNTQFVGISAKLTTATNLLLSRNATYGTAPSNVSSRYSYYPSEPRSFYITMRYNFK
jgi:hypothetical protein